MLLDLSHTSHTQARTGIQRVTRALLADLAARGLARPITWDPYARRWRALDHWEQHALTRTAGGRKRGAYWPWHARLRGWLRRATAPHEKALVAGSAPGLIVGELFSATVGQALPALLAQVAGPRIALFHDAIALKFPELSAPKTAARFPTYLQELTRFDGIAAVSEDSCDTLVDYWRWLGLTDVPPVVAIPLGIDLPTHADQTAVPTANAPTILCVGTLEGRKNHLSLLDACERLWHDGRQFQLRLIGLAQSETGQKVVERIHALQAAGHPLRYDGPVDEPTLTQAYRDCHFTIYPSLMEGFGLPVLESLAHGKPCICSNRGALGESAAGGGCLALPQVDAPHLAGAIDTLLCQPARHATLVAEARRRTYKTWTAYTDELLAWMGTLPARKNG
ncbi:MAG: glycosyltransferase family 4 protein [Opitutaceae bacterium]|nr:glycosyltransferase family 4 protein [Opitutaceae bacterium]